MTFPGLLWLWNRERDIQTLCRYLWSNLPTFSQLPSWILFWHLLFHSCFILKDFLLNCPWVLNATQYFSILLNICQWCVYVTAMIIEARSYCCYKTTNLHNNPEQSLHLKFHNTRQSHFFINQTFKLGWDHIQIIHREKKMLSEKTKLSLGFNIQQPRFYDGWTVLANQEPFTETKILWWFNCTDQSGTFHRNVISCFGNAQGAGGFLQCLSLDDVRENF